MKFCLLWFMFLSAFHSTSAIKKSYIVHLASPSEAIHPNSDNLELTKLSHYDLLGSFLGSTEQAREAILYSYTNVINGFAAVLEEEEAEEISKRPDVISVIPNKGVRLHTTHSWQFLGLEKHNYHISSVSAWKKANFGEDTIIATLDTGVWPESESFSDESYGPVPSRWKGTCKTDESDDVKCNRKLIGAKYFNKGYISYLRRSNKVNITKKLSTGRDLDGHGSHTLSTAGGNFVKDVSVFGNGRGTAKGGSPKARVASYKVCWPPIDGNGCFDADILAGFEAAIADGVDVLSLSLGGTPAEFTHDPIAMASLQAVKKGIVVVASAGNSGPEPSTVSNVAPWIFTVGASSTDRMFSNYAALGNKRHVKGVSLSGRRLKKFHRLISGDAARILNVSENQVGMCLPGTLDPKKVKGKIVLCFRGLNSRVNKGYDVSKAGGIGMILANTINGESDLMADPHFLPATHISAADGQSVYAYIKSTKKPVAYITKSKNELNVKPSPVMANFSSRGPNLIEPSILKPDVTAPGVNIIAAYSKVGEVTQVIGDHRHPAYMTLSGTSMSCPHVSGIAGLLKTLYPHWSPAAIRSAIMTAATSRDKTNKPIQDSDNKEATPFAYGSGHVVPNKAVDPGLIYDLDENDYLNFLCGHGYKESLIRKFSHDGQFKCPNNFNLANFNYPSITIPNLNTTVTISRKVKNVGSPGLYDVHYKAPNGVKITVVPESLKFVEVGEEKWFHVTFTRSHTKVKNLVDDGYVFGELTWSDGSHHVKSPIVVKL